MILSVWLFTTIGYLPSDQIIDVNHPPRPGRYSVPGIDGKAAWIIRGQGFGLDLASRTLVGKNDSAQSRDRVQGIGLLLDGCKNVTLKNLIVSGYQYDIVLRNCENVRVLNSRALESRSLRMGVDGTPIDASLKVRDLSAWKQYGAGFWLENCDQCRIEHCVATGSQNGILAVDSDHCTLFDNNCSYNGGWGIGLSHSSHNFVVWNHADFCNRPWNKGWGGDAAGLVVVNGSLGNGIIANSLTHGGDGFFLTDSVNGGYDEATKKHHFAGSSNRNIVAYNDASWSSNNAFEATFSDANIFYKNQADDSKYGFWLGYSNFSFLLGNDVLRNGIDGIAIEQGAQNTLFRNMIEETKGIGVHIWSSPGPVEFERPSKLNAVIENRIAGSPWALNLDRSIDTQVDGNTIERAEIPKGTKLGLPSLQRTQSLAAFAFTKDARRIASWMDQRPTNWKFYRETGGPTGPQALVVGDYSPRESR